MEKKQQSLPTHYHTFDTWFAILKVFWDLMFVEKWTPLMP